jgi:hypothetical protein
MLRRIILTCKGIPPWTPLTRNRSRLVKRSTHVARLYKFIALALMDCAPGTRLPIP